MMILNLHFVERERVIVIIQLRSQLTRHTKADNCQLTTANKTQQGKIVN